MLKPLLVLALLTAPALADSKTTTLDFKVSAGNQTRHYGLTLASDSCGHVESNAADARDRIKVCAKPDGNDLRLEIDWEMHSADREIKHSSTLIAARGKSFDLDGGAAKLTVAVR